MFIFKKNANWPFGDMTILSKNILWNDYLMKYHMMKWSFDEGTFQQMIISSNVHYIKMKWSIDEMPIWWNYFIIKIPQVEMTIKKIE